EVSNTSVVAGNASLTLKWTNPADEDLAKIIISGFGDTDVESVELGKDKVSHTFTGLTNGKQYQFILVAVDTAGNESEGVVVSGTPVRPSTDNDGGSGSGTVTAEPQGNIVEVKGDGEVNVKPAVKADGTVEVKLNSSVMQEAINKSTGNELNIKVED